MRRQLLLYLLLLCIAVYLFAQERHGPYKIHKFVDGNIFWVMVNPGKIQLIGVDTPEIKLDEYTIFWKVNISSKTNP
jgi:endonuclease YncB( thermonuclease family)